MSEPIFSSSSDALKTRYVLVISSQLTIRLPAKWAPEETYLLMWVYPRPRR